VADQTNISWCDHTFNAWWGCTQIAPGCDNCYAKALDVRFKGDYWNPKQEPRVTSYSNWIKPLRWDAKAKKEGRRYRVFCGSMMDWCDKDAPPDALDRLWSTIKVTPNLDWLLLTKRASRIRMSLPDDWGWNGYNNVWLGVSVEDKKHGYPRIDELGDISSRVSFLSVEPMLCDMSDIDLGGIDWVIIGGESGPGARPMNPDWAYDLMNTCRYKGIPVWFKQWGGTNREKGGSFVGLREIKQLPRGAKGYEN